MGTSLELAADNKTLKLNTVSDRIENRMISSRREIARMYEPIITYAQNFEDVYIRRIFEKNDGFYIDVGAFHPTVASVTKHFYDKGWSGINIDPSPDFVSLFECRDRDINLNVAISDGKDRTRPFFYHPEDPGTSSLQTALDEGLVDRIRQREAKEVEILTLDEVFQNYVGDRHVDFLKIDIEGQEKEVISSCNWRQYRPTLVVVESVLSYSKVRVDHLWNSILLENGYEFVFFDGLNTYFLDEASKNLGERLQWPIGWADRIVDIGSSVEERKRQIGNDVDSLMKADQQIVQLSKELSTSDASAQEWLWKIEDLEYEKQLLNDSWAARFAEQEPLNKAILKSVVEGTADGLADSGLAITQSVLIERIVERAQVVRNQVYAQRQKLLLESGFFESDYYLWANADVLVADLSPVDHFVKFGSREFRNPGPRFDSKAYLKANRDIADSGVEPFFHFMLYGEMEGRQALPAISPGTREIWKRILEHSRIFDRVWYLGTYEDILVADTDPFDHFLDFGMAERRSPSSAFDADTYLTVNPDVAAAGHNPLIHYLSIGRFEGREAPRVLVDPAEPLRRLLEHSGFFVPSWYLGSYEDVWSAGVDPLGYFLKHGLDEGHSPGPAFDADAYLAAYPEVAATGQNALIHFLTEGRFKGYGAIAATGLSVAEIQRNLIQHSGFFDPSWYLGSYEDVCLAGANPLEHFLKHGLDEGRNPGPAFDTGAYLAAYPEVAATGQNALIHFLTEGRFKGYEAIASTGLSVTEIQRNLIQHSGFFVPSWYLGSYEDVWSAGVDPLEHFLKHGLDEGHSPGPAFDADAYLAAYPEVAATGQNALIHFLTEGRFKGYGAIAATGLSVAEIQRNLIQHSGFFDPSWYLGSYEDVCLAGANPLEHFLKHGLDEGRNPGPAFDTGAYLAAYPEVAATGQNALIHFLTTGRFEGREAPRVLADPSKPLRRLIEHSGFFDPSWYLGNYEDVWSAGTNPLEHFLKHGLDEGRSPGPAFDTGAYLAAYPDAAATGQNALIHFLTGGRFKGYEAIASTGPNTYEIQKILVVRSGLFDEVWYRRKNRKVIPVGQDPLTQFVRSGDRQLRSPSRNFDSRDYLDRYPDVANAEVGPLLYHLSRGIFEGRSIRPMPRMWFVGLGLRR